MSRQENGECSTLLHQCFLDLLPTVNEQDIPIIQSYGYTIVSIVRSYNVICSEFRDALVAQARISRAASTMPSGSEMQSSPKPPRVLSLRSFRFAVNLFLSLRSKVSLSPDLLSQFTRSLLPIISFAETLLAAVLTPIPSLNESMPIFVKDYIHTTLVMIKFLLRELSAPEYTLIYKKNKDLILARVVALSTNITSEDVATRIIHPS